MAGMGSRKPKGRLLCLSCLECHDELDDVPGLWRVLFRNVTRGHFLFCDKLCADDHADWLARCCHGRPVKVVFGRRHRVPAGTQTQGGGRP